MHRVAAYDSARARQRGCAHALEQPSAEAHRLSAAEDAPVDIVSCRSVHGLVPRSLLLKLLMTVLRA